MSVPERALDELISWSLNRRGRVTGFTGLRREYRFNLLSRFLLPDLRPDFADQGDVIEIEQAPSVTSRISIPANLTRRRALSLDPGRVQLCALLILALPLPAVVIGGRWWLLILSALTAGLFLYDLRASGIAQRRTVTEDGATLNIAAWRIIRRHYVAHEPPSVAIRDGPEPDWPALLDRAYADALDDHEVVAIATLPVPDGKLLACEPFQIHDPRPYTIPVPPGTYPVFISIAAAPDTPDQRIAYAWVRLRQGTPARWEPARTRGGEEVNVGVDSGIAGFMSATAAPAMIEAYRRPDCDYVEPLSEAVVAKMDKVWRDTRGWAELEIEDGARLAAFSSGFGDGVYPVYRALDARGRRLAVAMIFFVDW